MTVLESRRFASIAIHVMETEGQTLGGNHHPLAFSLLISICIRSRSRALVRPRKEGKATGRNQAFSFETGHFWPV